MSNVENSDQLDPYVVEIDVERAIASMVESRGVSYRPDLVPEKEPDDGLGADEAGWLGLLMVVRDDLHAQRDEYRVLEVDGSDALATIDKEINRTRRRLTDKILAGQEPQGIA